MFITFLWLSSQRWIIKAYENQRHIINWSALHWLDQKRLWTASVPIIPFRSFFILIFYYFYYFCIIKFVPESIRTNNNDIVIIYFKASDLRLIDYNFIIRIFCLKISKRASCGKSTWENSQRTCDSIISSICNLSYCGCLIYFPTCFNDSFLLLIIWRLMIFGNLIAFAELLTH